VFEDAGAELLLASLKGGRPPLGPRSSKRVSQTDLTRRFDADGEANAALSNTSRLEDVTHEGVDAVFHPGGHGSLWALAEDPASIQLIETTLRIGKPFALLCHAPGVLRHAKSLDGKPLIEGKALTGLTNTKEEAVGLTSIVPFLVQDELRRHGGVSSKAGDWQPYVV
jgi:putative intracellular protease/amidase